MAAHGNIEEFDRSVQDWTEYCEWLEQYFLANDVQDATKRPNPSERQLFGYLPAHQESGGSSQTDRQVV